MTNVNQIRDRMNFFVTHVRTSGQWLQICGQIDRNSAREVERLISFLKEGFDRGIGVITSKTFQLGICCAYHEDNYYRAKVLKIEPDSRIYVEFIDYGNTEYVHVGQMRLLDGTAEGLKLQSIPPLMLDFPVTTVMPFNNMWNRTVIDHINNLLRYNEFPVDIIDCGNHRIFTLYYNGQDFTEFLVNNQMALLVPSNQPLRPPHDAPIVKQHQQPLQQPGVMYRPAPAPTPAPAPVPCEPHPMINNNNDNYPMKLRQPRTIVNNKPVQENWRRPYPTTIQQMRPPSSTSPRTQDSAAFKSRNLERDTKHQVLVSDVEDGPLKFNVQLQSCAQELETLMRNINTLPLKSLQDPPIHGAACLALNTKTQLIRRAVVSTVIDTLKLKVWYCDFGDQEILPHSSIFEIPPNYANPQALSIIFTLSGVRELTVTKEMKNYFKELVLGKILTLVVMPREDSPLMHYGNLFIDGKSVLQLLLEAFPDSAIKFPEAPRLTAGTRENVHVSYVHACSKFFVQLAKNVLDMEALSNHLIECVKIAPPIKASTIRPGLKCLAHSSADSEWYRAEVISVADNQVTVHYVDYGNDETIPCNAIRSIRSDDITKIPIQAVQCVLNGFESVPYKPEVDDKFEAYVLDKPLVMTVLDVKSSGIVVDLYDSNVKPIANISAKLRNGTLDLPSMPPAVQPQPPVQPATQYQKEVTDNSKKSYREKSEESDSWSSKNHNDSYPQSHENSSFENARAKNWKNADNEDKRYNNREQKSNSRDWSGHCDRSNRDYSRNERFNKESSAPRYDRNDTNDRFDNDGNVNNRRDRSGGRGRIHSSGSRDRFDRDRNNAGDTSWSDKDSNASSRGSGRRGRRPDRGGPRGGSSHSRGGRGGNSGVNSGSRRDRARSTSNENENESDRNFKYNNRSNDYNNHNSSDNTRFKPNNQRFNDQRNDRNKKSEIDTWDPVSAAVGSNEYSSPSSSVQITPPNITLGAIKHCEVVFINSPTDFHVQLKPDNLELDPVMDKIAQLYETGGNNLPQSNAKVGVSCIAQYSEDFKWYRAVIQSVESTGVTVRFVDYGNIEIVSFDKIKELEADLAKLPVQAINCKLLGASKTTWDTNEINEFTSLTDMKLLEAEFIAQENDVYEVLIREVVNNEPVGPYINETYCNPADLSQAKEVAKNKNRSSRGSKPATHVSSTNYAPLDRKWSEPVINLSVEEDVIVTWLTNPDNFYCQLLRTSKDFRTMMNEIQKIYARRQPAQDNIAVGSSVIAIFADDGAFYRAEVIKVKSGNYEVRYVDFGNTATVKSREIFRVDEKFMDLPKQAVLCCLKNVVPRGGTGWSNADHNEIDRLFNVDQLRCCFNEVTDGKYLVSMTNNGIDLADTLVKKGLAEFPSAPSADIPLTKEIHEPEENADSGHHLSQIDISYLRGQVLRVKVSKVENVNKFYIQLPSAEASEKIINDYMANQNQEVMPKLLPREVCLGAGCLVYTDKGWRRAVVVNLITQTTNYDVRFIDTGEIDVVPLNCMLTLPGELSAMQKQSVECSLKNVVSSPTDDENLRNLIENSEVIIRVDSVNDNRLVVEVFNDSGKKISLQNEAEESISPLCPMPIFFHQHRVIVSHVNNSKSLWLKRLNADTDAVLLDELYEYYSRSGQLLNIEIDKLCAAQSVDMNWYRAKIVSKTDSGALVRYVDYGNTEAIPYNRLKELEPKFFKPSQLALEVRLKFNVVGGIKEQEILKCHLLNKSFIATLQLNANNKWTVSLSSQSGEQLEDQLRELGFIDQDNSQAAVVSNEIPVSDVADEPEDLIVGGRYKVVVAHVENPTQFWIQRANDLPAIEQLEKKLQEDAPNYLPIEGVPEDNLICAALDTENSLWNRAEVIVADAEMVTVRYIDYGNTDILLDMTRIKQLPDSMLSIKCYATKCRLDLIPIDCEDWNESAIASFADKTLENNNLTAVVIADGNSKRVDLIDDHGSITKMLVDENLAKQIQAHEDVIDELVENVLDPRSTFICHINSPDEFWIQEEKSVADLECIADRFIVADMFPKITQVKPGELCVAKFPDDNSWYRARIISHGKMGTNVFYIDYGNSAVSTEIREIPDDVSAIPPLSRKCRLPLPQGVEKWSDAACQEFTKLADDGATIFFLDVLEEGETSTVKLTLDGEDIINSLEKLCEKSSPVEKLTESGPQTDSTENRVFVSHANAPYDFYIQEQKHTTDLDVMAERLKTADEYSPIENIDEGLLCAAQFPEDSAWYRARVLSHGSSGTQVIYIDYGNTAVTAELRDLPDDLKTLAPLSRHCRLASPGNVEQWPCEAYQEFIKLVDNGLTEFKMNIIDEADDISTVQLLLGDEDVAEKLNQYCNKSVPVIEERLSPLGEETTPNVMISHVISPSEFWIQAENKITELESMAIRLSDADNYLPLGSLNEIGVICAAKFPEDDQWYRAKVQTHQDPATETEVIFIDYGNSSLTTEVRVLPEDLAVIPPLAKYCALEIPDGVECWSLEACEKFIELTAEGQTMFECKELDGQDPTYVSLKLDGQDVVEILAPLCASKEADKTEDQKPIPVSVPVSEPTVEKVVNENVESVDCKLNENENEKQSMHVNIKIEKEFDSHTYEKSHEETMSSNTSGVDVLTNSDNSNDDNPFGNNKVSEIVNSTLKHSVESDAADYFSATSDTLITENTWIVTENISKFPTASNESVDITTGEETIIEVVRNLSELTVDDKLNKISQIVTPPVLPDKSIIESVNAPIDISSSEVTVEEQSTITEDEIPQAELTSDAFVDKQDSIIIEDEITPADVASGAIVEKEVSVITEEKNVPSDLTDAVIVEQDSVIIEDKVASPEIVEVLVIEQEVTGEKLTPAEEATDDVVDRQETINAEETITPTDTATDTFVVEQDSVIIVEKISPAEITTDAVVEEQDCVIIEHEILRVGSESQPMNKSIVNEELTPQHDAVIESSDCLVKEKEANDKEQVSPSYSVPPSPMRELPRYGRRSSTPHEDKIVPGCINKGIDLDPEADQVL
ncbi:maternal protein tudor-like isoform X2 [Microplitis mediator]|uniref:maternal protein tudor-like isoform X2 n=1 Tax=Microplitis mediator TaxID=375433 RepID=UPI00255276F8|nr:maternal protein tudor-like isoform X2 [Microplitis mediator]